MSYYASAQAMTISRARALQELERHCVDADGLADFFTELGNCAEYDAQDVLAWLGY